MTGDITFQLIDPMVASLLTGRDVNPSAQSSGLSNLTGTSSLAESNNVIGFGEAKLIVTQDTGGEDTTTQHRPSVVYDKDTGLRFCASTIAKRRESIKNVAIMEGLEEVTALEGTDVTYRCTLSEDVAVTWYKNGVKLSESSSIEIYSEGFERFLVLKNVGADDQGDIKVRTESGQEVNLFSAYHMLIIL